MIISRFFFFHLIFKCSLSDKYEKTSHDSVLLTACHPRILLTLNVASPVPWADKVIFWLILLNWQHFKADASQPLMYKHPWCFCLFCQSVRLLTFVVLVFNLLFLLKFIFIGSDFSGSVMFTLRLYCGSLSWVQYSATAWYTMMVVWRCTSAKVFNHFPKPCDFLNKDRFKWKEGRYLGRTVAFVERLLVKPSDHRPRVLKQLMDTSRGA